MKNLFDVLKDKENQLKELHAEIKRVEEQIEKLRAAANILSEDPELASVAGGQNAPAPQPVTSAAAAAPSGTSKRWMP